MIRIDSYKLRQYGERGFTLSVPKVYVEDKQMRAGDDIDIYRAIIDGDDCLILKPQRSNGKNKPESSSKSQQS